VPVTKIKGSLYANTLLVCEVQLDTREFTAILAQTTFDFSNQFLNLDAVQVGFAAVPVVGCKLSNNQSLFR
jgi:hypothetical protein